MVEYQLKLKTNADASSLDELINKLQTMTELEEETGKMVIKPDADPSAIDGLLDGLLEVEEQANKPIAPKIDTGGLTQGIANFGAKSAEVFNNIGSRCEKLGSKFESLSSSMGSLLAGIGLAEMATDAWEGATEKQTNQLLLARKYGDNAAATMVQGMNDIVKATPGDDQFLSAMLSNASLQAKMTNKDLKDLADSIADYQIMSKAAGSSTVEAQGEIRNYIMTGETGRMKDTALVPYLDELEGADTITERVKVLNKALEELGYKGAAGMGSAANSMETFKGTIQAALTSVGTAFLPAIQKLLDKFLALDEALGGNLSKALVVVGGGFAGIVAATGALGAVLPAIGRGIQAVGTGIDVLTKGPQIIKGIVQGFQSVREVITLVREAETLSEGIKAAYTASLTAEAAAADASAASTGLLATAEWSALIPILLVVAAIVALVAILWYLYNNNEQVRQAVDNLIASVQGLISSFLEAVQPVIDFVQQSISQLMPFVMVVQGIFGEIFNVIMSVLGAIVVQGINNITSFISKIRVVLGILPLVIGLIFRRVQNFILTAIARWNIAVQKAKLIVDGITGAFQGVVDKISGALSGVYDAITAPFQRAYNTLKPILDAIDAGIDLISKIPGFGGSAGVVLGSAGIVTGGSVGLGNANEQLMSNVSNTVAGTTNINLNGIIEESAGDFIVRKLNDRLYKERITRGL